MARERPTASDVQQTLAELGDTDVDPASVTRAVLDVGVLSHAQASALRRCAPLTRAEVSDDAPPLRPPASR